MSKERSMLSLATEASRFKERRRDRRDVCFSSRPRVASLCAKADVRVLEIHKPAFEAILRERPETALALMRVLCERLAPYDPVY
jgi:CRP-like cAMP-binding protein